MHTVLLARHGETEWNRTGRRQGRLDSPLTDRGSVQARRLGQLSAQFPVDAVFVSPLGRAQRTAELVGESVAAPVRVLPELIEVDFGVLGGWTEAEIERDHPDESGRAAAQGYGYRYPGGESFAEVDARAAAAMTVVAAAGVSCPLLVSHGIVGRMLLRQLLDEPIDALASGPQGNDMLYVVDVAARRLRELR